MTSISSSLETFEVCCVLRHEKDLSTWRLEKQIIEAQTTPILTTPAPNKTRAVAIRNFQNTHGLWPFFPASSSPPTRIPFNLQALCDPRIPRSLTISHLARPWLGPDPYGSEPGRWSRWGGGARPRRETWNCNASGGLGGSSQGQTASQRSASYMEMYVLLEFKIHV